MTNHELLELAAKAAGYDKLYQRVSLSNRTDGIFSRYVKRTYWVSGIEHCDYWNPLTDDGDALRLAVSLHLELRPSDTSVTAAGNGVWEEVDVVGDRLAATRRAIVRAAAEIGRTMP